MGKYNNKHILFVWDMPDTWLQNEFTFEGLKQQESLVLKWHVVLLDIDVPFRIVDVIFRCF